MRLVSGINYDAVSVGSAFSLVEKGSVVVSTLLRRPIGARGPSELEKYANTLSGVEMTSPFTGRPMRARMRRGNSSGSSWLLGFLLSLQREQRFAAQWPT